jgi:hypothetical protein
LGTGYPFSSFPTKTCIWIIFLRIGIPSLSITWCYATMIVIGWSVVLIACFLSLDLIFVLWLTWLLARLMCYFCPWPGSVN